MSCNNVENKKIEPPKKQLREKEFKIRDSPLTVRIENNEDIKTIYNLFAVILISLLVNTVIHDYTKFGRLHFGSRLIISGFNKFEIAILIWCFLNVLAGIIYFVFRFWSTIRILLKPKTAKLWDQIWLVLLVIYYSLSLYMVQRFIVVFEFRAGSSAVLLLEEVRLLMKQHAYIRTNLTRVLSFKPHTEKKLYLPSFEKFIYFFFAPTLIYRDEYPRTQHIRWKFVIINLLEILFIIVLLSLVIERFLIPPFEEFGLRKFTKGELLINIFGNSFPGIIFMLAAFYSVLHASQNAFAEILRFGDRLFYKEWWTCRSLSEWHRSWNIIVQDWLFTYVYKDVYEHVARNKTVAQVSVFLLSAVVHEWILINCLGLFMPIQFTQFFLTGAVLSVLRILDLRIGNIFVWYSLVLGSGIQVNLYTLEFIAGMNCPASTNSSFIDFFTPKFLTCDSIV